MSPPLIPASSHWPLSVTSPVWSPSGCHSSGPPFLLQVPRAAGVWDSQHSAIPARSSSKNRFPPFFPFLLLFFLFYFLFPCCASLCFALLDSFLPFPHQFLLTQGEFQRQVAFAVLLYLKMVDKTPSLDASEATRHPKVSSTFLEEEHHHHLEQKVRTLGFELGGV